jgi:flagellar biosynthesis/type III secretory pathway protein FliH
MTLPAGLERNLRREIEEFEEAQRMKYVSTIERWAEQRGIEQGIERGKEEALREAILDVLEERFNGVPDQFEYRLNQIEDSTVLQKLLRQAVTIASLDLFAERIAEVTSTNRED